MQTADYHTLLRIPGVGVKSARRIMAARRLGKLDYTSLKKFGVVLKRAMYFVTCGGKTMVPLRMNELLYSHESSWFAGTPSGSSYRGRPL